MRYSRPFHFEQFEDRLLPSGSFGVEFVPLARASGMDGLYDGGPIATIRETNGFSSPATFPGLLGYQLGYRGWMQTFEFQQVDEWVITSYNAPVSLSVSAVQEFQPQPSLDRDPGASPSFQANDDPSSRSEESPAASATDSNAPAAASLLTTFLPPSTQAALAGPSSSESHGTVDSPVFPGTILTPIPIVSSTTGPTQSLAIGTNSNTPYGFDLPGWKMERISTPASTMFQAGDPEVATDAAATVTAPSLPAANTPLPAVSNVDPAEIDARIAGVLSEAAQLGKDVAGELDPAERYGWATAAILLSTGAVYTVYLNRKRSQAALIAAPRLPGKSDNNE